MIRNGLPLLIVLLPALAAGQQRLREDVTKDVKGLGIRVDMTYAEPGGVLVAFLRSAKAIGPASFALEGRRAPVYSGPGGLRALVPVPLTMVPGPAPLGLEIRSRRGRRRIALEVTIGPRSFVPRTHTIPEGKKALLAHPERTRDSRLVLGALREGTPVAHHRGRLLPPVAAAPESFFGALETYEGATFVPLLMDGVYGDHHRGLDYPVAIGTPVLAPAAGVVTLAQPLAFGGHTIILDHGRGVVSVFFHLSKLGVAVGERVEGRAVIGASGDSGLATLPHLHWAVYVHGVAVDPQIIQNIELG
jgi:murein DD-endopeptidase MepM/ murein hydrolase activator NlpD